jgi:ATP-dependent helicase/nuclease subunit B
VALNLFTVPPETPFLDALAHGWLANSAGPFGAGKGLILLPTKRAARSLADSFLRANNGKPLLLPRITALGALDEAPLALTGALDLPPPIEPMQRLAALTRLILGLHKETGAPRTADRAWPLARELAALMDEAERSDVDLAETLPDAADPAFAMHWSKTLEFLKIVTQAWPAHLAENGVMNPAARQAALLDAQSEVWATTPPKDPVLIAGVTASIPAVTRLLRTVANLPNGQVVLPHLDMHMDDAAWDAMEPSHAQAGLARLLSEMGASRGDVRPWPATGTMPMEGRFRTLSRALLPAESLTDWLDPTPGALAGFHRLTPEDQQQEAQSIALVLRNAIETPGARAALVTPDRSLAERVAAALGRFGIVADDSAGEPLALTPPAVFLRLLVRAIADNLAPVPLLALLKHPFAAAGLSPIACREAARALETACLRGPRPTPGIAGLRMAVDKDAPELKPFLDRLEHCLEPALRFETAVELPAADAVDAVIQSAERLAATDERPGADRLWANEEGNQLAATLTEFRAASALIPDLRRGTMPGLLDEILEGTVVRSRRALRAGGQAEHPRIHIWGLLEARLQTADLIVLGGLAETVWPPLPEPGPWLSRPMRAKIGLPEPDERIGQAAHDFLSACCAAPTVVLSCPQRRDGAPAVPSRWLTRLDMFLKGRNQTLPDHPAAAWAAALDQPIGDPIPVRPPKPLPPVRLRPRRLSVTEIETWLRDPYAIHARHILRLPPLKPLDEGTDAADYGLIVHDALNLFLSRHGAAWPPNAAAELRSAMRRALGAAGLRPALQAWWTPRLDRIADWVAAEETRRRADAAPTAINAEAKGRIDLIRPGGRFRLTGRADRIERYPDNTLAILDYKTGKPPSQKDVDSGFAPQLVLEAAMAAEGGFGDDWKGTARYLIYWHLSGGIDPGEASLLFRKTLSDVPHAAADALDRLKALIDAFDDPGRPYLSRPNPDQASRFSQYDQLARVAEWSQAGGEDE